MFLGLFFFPPWRHSWHFDQYTCPFFSVLTYFYPLIIKYLTLLFYTSTKSWRDYIFIAICLCVSVCQWTKFQPNRCINLDMVFTKRLLTYIYWTSAYIGCADSSMSTLALRIRLRRYMLRRFTIIILKNCSFRESNLFVSPLGHRDSAASRWSLALFS